LEPAKVSRGLDGTGNGGAFCPGYPEFALHNVVYLWLQEFAEASHHEHGFVVGRALHVFGQFVMWIVRDPYVL
jgi:hypothetical protein